MIDRRTTGAAWLVALAALTLPATTTGQTDACEALRASAWRDRNRAARELAAGDGAPIAALLEVLAADDVRPAGIFHGAFGFGSYRPQTADPRVLLLRDAGERVADNLVGSLVEHVEPRAPGDLCCPWSSHELALWLLLERDDAHDAHREQASALPRDSVPRVRAWLRLAEPDDDELLAHASTPDAANTLAQALFLQGPNGHERLRRLLVQSRHLCAAATLLDQDAVFGERAARAALVDLALADDSPRSQQAGRRLLYLGADVAPLLAQRCADATDDVAEHALDLLCLFGDDAAPTVDVVIEELARTRPRQMRALVALASFDVPDDRCARLFAATAPLLASADASVQVLAADAIARGRAGLDDRTRKALEDVLTETDDRLLASRVLGCLRAHDAVPDWLPTAHKLELALDPDAPTSAWLAVADDGAAGAEAVAATRLPRSSAKHQDAFAERLAQTAPEVLRDWLDAFDLGMRRIALHGLCSLGPDELSDDALVEWMGESSLLRDLSRTRHVAYRTLLQRRVAPRTAEAVLTHMAEHVSIRETDEEVAFVQACGLGAERKLELLHDCLRQSKGWRTVRDLPTALRREKARALLADGADTDPGVRPALVAELCRAGLDGADDEALVLDALRGDRRFAVLDALQDGPSLPDAVRTALQAIFDEVPPDDEPPGLGDFGPTRSALLAHARRAR